MKTRILSFLLLFLSFFGVQAQTTKTAAKTSIDSLLPSGNAVQMVKVRTAFEKALNFTESVKSRSNHTGTQAISTITGLESAINSKAGMFSVAQVRAFAVGDVTANPRIIVTDVGKEGEWRYNAGSSATDNTGTVLITSNGARYERVYEGAIKASWFEVSGDTHTGQSITRAVTFAISKFANTNSETVLIKSGTNSVDNSPVYTTVPLNKKLTIKGEVGNIIDFLCVECQGAVFSNSASWTYADSVYTHGHIVLDGLNFEGNRNPVSAYLSVNYGTRPILYRNMQRVEVRNCNFRNIYGSSLAVGATASVLIENNTAKGVYARQPNNMDATGDGLATIYAHCHDIIIRGNYAQLLTGQYGRCAVSVDDLSDNFQVINNIIEGYERGIHIENSREGIVAQNNISRSPIAIVSGINRNVLYENNVIDGKNVVYANTLTYPGLVFFYNDTATVFRGNTVKNWHGLPNTYLGKFWGNDIRVESNIWEPNRANAEVYGYGYNYRNSYIKNEFRGGTKLRIDYTFHNTVEGNTFWGGTVQTHNSEDATVKGNTVRPDIGSNTGSGLVIYNSIRPYVADNTVINPVTYVIENGLTTNAIFEKNTYLRTHASAAAYSAFFVNTSIPATGVKKTAADRYNIVRDFINDNAYYIGNTGSPTAY
jgi:parallel beta-helix repeat protein